MTADVAVSFSIARRTVSAEEFRKLFGVDVVEAGEGAPPKVQAVSGPSKVRWVTHPELPQGRGHDVCPVCASLHNTVYERKDANRPRAPLHDNCYCTVEPHWEEGDEAMMVPDHGPLQQSQRRGQFLQRWMRQTNVARLAGLLGKGRARLVKAGLVKAEELVTPQGRLRTLAELLERLGLTRKRFDGMTMADLRAYAKGR